MTGRLGVDGEFATLNGNRTSKLRRAVSSPASS